MGFFAELKRRNVIRVGVAYLIAAWLLLQVVDVVGPILELPDWAPKLVLLILAVGFVPVLVFAWAFELTPEGIKRESDVDRDRSITHVTARKLDYVTIGLVLAVAVMTGVDRWLPRGTVGSESIFPGQEQDAITADGEKSTLTPAAPPPKSIAVLPFVNMSEDTSNEYFSDGISEEILNALARVRELKVAGRTSSFAFKGENQDLRVIGDALGVSHILEGSVRKAGSRVRITAQLVQADDGFHVWSETYDRELTDVFAIQDEISAAILRELKAHLVGEQTLGATRTDTRAYELYLLAGQRIYERNQASLELAADLLGQAIDIDPEYAPAYAQLGTATMLLSDFNYGTIPLEQALDRAKPLLDKALELDPGNAEALAAMGLYYQIRKDNAESITRLERAIAINPNLTNANLWLSSALAESGELQRSLALLESSFARDPLHPPTFANLANNLALTGRLAEARAMLEDLQRFLPGDASLLGSLGGMEVLAGDWARADRLLTRSTELEPLNFIYHAWLSVVLFGTGQFERLEESGAPGMKALALGRAGRHEEALELTARVLRLGINADLHFQVLAEDGRFAELAAIIESRWPDLDRFEADFSSNGLGALGLILIAQAYARLGREAPFNDALRHARGAVDRQVQAGYDNWILSLSRAGVASLEGDYESALDLLDQAVAAGALPRSDMEGPYSVFEPLQGNPRYQAILQRIREHRNAERAALGLEPLT